MKTKILVMLLAVLFIVPTIVLADVTAYKDRYYYAGAPLGSYDPTDDDPSATDWNGDFTAGVPDAPIILAPGEVIVLAMRNIRVDANKKLLRAYIEYVGTDDLVLDDVGHGSANGMVSVGGIKEETLGTGVYDLKYWIIPQPDWEYVVIRNNGGAPITINKAVIETNCSPIPSLTPYGIMLLVLLLAGTAVWVMRRRSAVVSI